MEWKVRRYRRPLVDSRAITDVDTSSGCATTSSKQVASMNANVIYVGIDVDDVRYQSAAQRDR